jgi:hypothetical protein
MIRTCEWSSAGSRRRQAAFRDGVQAHRINTDRWWAVNASHLVALVLAGAVFKNGKLNERPDESEDGDQQVA